MSWWESWRRQECHEHSTSPHYSLRSCVALMVVRFADHGDVPVIAALLEDTGLQIEGVPYDNFSHPCFVAEVDGKVVGMLQVLLGHPLSVVTDMAVAPEWQRRGVGKELVMAMERVVKGMGYRTLATCVRVDRELSDHLKSWPGARHTGLATMWVKSL